MMAHSNHRVIVYRDRDRFRCEVHDCYGKICLVLDGTHKVGSESYDILIDRARILANLIGCPIDERPTGLDKSLETEITKEKKVAQIDLEQSNGRQAPKTSPEEVRLRGALRSLVHWIDEVRPYPKKWDHRQAAIRYAIRLDAIKLFAGRTLRGGG